MPRGGRGVGAADSEWEDVGQTGDEKEIMGMCVYNGAFVTAAHNTKTHLRHIVSKYYNI